MANPAIITTWTLLKNAIEDHLNRSDVDDEGVSAMLIDFAEARFNREIRHPQMLDRDDAFTVDSQYEDVPAGFLEAKRFALNTNPTQILEFISFEEMGEKRSRNLTSSGRPLYYTITGALAGGMSFEFLPSPEQAYTGLLVYYQRVPALSVSQATNWLLDNHPDVYLAACLSEAHLYFPDPEEYAKWEARTLAGIQSINNAGQSAAFGTPKMVARSFG